MTSPQIPQQIKKQSTHGVIQLPVFKMSLPYLVLLTLLWLGYLMDVKWLGGGEITPHLNICSKGAMNI